MTSSGAWFLAVAPSPVSSMQIWVDGEQLVGGCKTAVECKLGLALALPAHRVLSGLHSLVVRVNASADGGMTRRLFVVGKATAIVE